MLVLQDRDEIAKPDIGPGLRIALRTVQVALVACAGWQLFRIDHDENAVNAFAGSVPWVILILLTLLLVPPLVRRGWRRFGRTGPTWAIAAIVATTTWAISTVLCWMALTIVLILTD